MWCLRIWCEGMWHFNEKSLTLGFSNLRKTRGPSLTPWKGAHCQRIIPSLSYLASFRDRWMLDLWVPGLCWWLIDRQDLWTGMMPGIRDACMHACMHRVSEWSSAIGRRSDPLSSDSELSHSELSSKETEKDSWKERRWPCRNAQGTIPATKYQMMSSSATLTFLQKESDEPLMHLCIEWDR